MKQDELRMSKTTQASYSTSPSKIQQKKEKSLSKCEQADQEQQNSLYEFDNEQNNTKFQRFQTIQPEKIQQSDSSYNQSNMRKTQLPQKQDQEIIELLGNFHLKKPKQNHYQQDQQDQYDQYDDVAMCVEEGKSTNIKKEQDENENNIHQNDDQFQ